MTRLATFTDPSLALPPTRARISDLIVPLGAQFSTPLEGKAELSMTTTERGDIEIEGWACVYDGLDSAGENFERGAINAAARDFLRGSAALCFQHDGSKVLGKVLSLEDSADGYGMRMRAIVYRQLPGSPLFSLYESVRRGALRGLSLGGFWDRTYNRILGRPMISNVQRITELSLTGVPVHSRATLTAMQVART